MYYAADNIDKNQNMEAIKALTAAQRSERSDKGVTVNVNYSININITYVNMEKRPYPPLSKIKK